MSVSTTSTGSPLERRQELHRAADADDDLHLPAELQQLPHALADEVVVVGDGHPQHRSDMRPPTGRSARRGRTPRRRWSRRRGRLQPERGRRAPRPGARSPTRPLPSKVAVAAALVADRDPQAARRQRSQHHARAVRSRVLEHVGQRLGDHEERGALDLGREADGRDPGIGVDRDRDRQQVGPRLDGRGSPWAPSSAGCRPATSVAQVAEALLGQLVSRGQRLRRQERRRSISARATASRASSATSCCCGAVVQVALDLAPDRAARPARAGRARRSARRRAR